MVRVTLTDVARHCGVSRSTVSLVLNNSPLVSAVTAARVRQAMTDLGYVYNRAAASLRTHRSNAIGVVLPQVSSSYFGEFAAGLHDALAGSDSVALITVSGEDRDLQRRQLQSLVERNVDGIVLVPVAGSTAADLPGLPDTPLVLALRPLPGASADYVANVEGDSAGARDAGRRAARLVLARASAPVRPRTP